MKKDITLEEAKRFVIKGGEGAFFATAYVKQKCQIILALYGDWFYINMATHHDWMCGTIDMKTQTGYYARKSKV